MKPAPFRYYAPRSLDEAMGLLAEHGTDAKPLAGGQSLIPAMNFRLAQPKVLVDLNRIEGLAGIADEGPGDRVTGGLRIGAMTREVALERSPLVPALAPLLAEALPHIAHPQIRTRGTVGGSLSHADPAAELPAVMVALEAKFRLQDLSGGRWVDAPAFYTGLFETALKSGELLLEISIPPLPPRSGCAFLEVARRHGDYALVGVCARLTLNEAGAVSDARVVLLSVGEGPVRAVGAERTATGGPVTGDRVRAAAETAARDIDPPSDIHASASYRRQLTRVLVRRGLERAYARAAAP